MPVNTFRNRDKLFLAGFWDLTACFLFGSTFLFVFEKGEMSLSSWFRSEGTSFAVERAEAAVTYERRDRLDNWQRLILGYTISQDKCYLSETSAGRVEPRHPVLCDAWLVLSECLWTGGEGATPGEEVEPGSKEIGVVQAFRKQSQAGLEQCNPATRIFLEKGQYVFQSNSFPSI